MSQGHSPTPLGARTGLTWCPRCGLVFGNNWITQLCVRLGCDYKEMGPYLAWARGGFKAVPPEGSTP